MDAEHIPFTQTQLALKNLSPYAIIEDFCVLLESADTIYIRHGDGKQSPMQLLPIEVMSQVIPLGDFLVGTFEGEKGWSARAQRKGDQEWFITYYHHPEYEKNPPFSPNSFELPSLTLNVSEINSIEVKHVDKNLTEFKIIYKNKRFLFFKLFYSDVSVYMYFYEPDMGQEPYEPILSERIGKLEFQSLLSFLTYHCWDM